MSNITRKDFDAMTPPEKRKFFVGGGVVTDPALERGQQISDPSVLTRAEFFALPLADQLAEIRAGRRIVDGERVKA